MKHEQHYSAPFALSSRVVRTLLRSMTIVTAISVLAACGNSTEVESNTQGNTGGNSGGDGPEYLGDPPVNDEIQKFKTEFWNPLAENNRCGQCHSTDGQAANFPFVDLFNINSAFSAAVGVNNSSQLIVDRSNPALSRAVVKVREGHQCWLGNDSASSGNCADIIEGYITNWTSGASTSEGRSIKLEAPTFIKDPGSSRNFPETTDAFEATLYTPVLAEYCADCHSETSDTPQAPFFASGDINVAYAAAMSKINLDAIDDSGQELLPLPLNSAEQSRFVTRVLELHNCWSSDCSNDADVMRLAIFDFAKDITLTEIDQDLKTSKAMNFENATLASGGDRYENSQIAIWEFKKGVGTIANDTSGIEPAIDLEFNNGPNDGSVSWVLGYGIELSGGAFAKATGTSEKLANLIAPNNSYSIEAWVIPANVTQEDARIISFASGDGTTRNFSMSQHLYQYEFLNRATENDETTEGALVTLDTDEDLQSALQHVVYTFDPVNGRRIYVNGVFTGDTDSQDALGGSLVEWNNSFSFILGSGIANNAWSGKLRMVAIHNSVLSQEQITQNFTVGVGQKYFMLFSVSDLITGLQPEDSQVYVVMQAEVYDNTSYLFDKPVFINLNGEYIPSTDIPIEGMRIGINGKEAITGQAFGNIEVNINSDDYTIDGQTISRMGTVIPIGKGPENDEFFLTFERFGDNTNVRVEAEPTAPQAPPEADPVSDLGVKTFDEINASLSNVTGIPTTNSSIAAAYESYKQQLPSIEEINAFLPSHQMAVAQLAMSYCEQLVQTDKDNFFSGFNFNLLPGTAFDTLEKRKQIVDPLLVGIMNLDTATGRNLSTQPDPDVLHEIIGSPVDPNLLTTIDDPDKLATYDYPSLLTTILTCDSDPENEIPDCTTQRTEKIVIAICAATLGSAMTVIQ